MKRMQQYGIAAAATAALIMYMGMTLPVAATLVANGSFEAETFTVAPGYSSQPGNGPITGWTLSDADRIGLNTPGGQNSGVNAFADNGAVPDGFNVAFVQESGGTATWISQSIAGLVPGLTYDLSLRYDSRNFGNSAIDVSVGGTSLFSDSNVSPVEAPGNYTQPYHLLTTTFVATSTSELLKIMNNSAGSDRTLLVDAVAINLDPISMPEPSTVVLLGMGGLLLWRRKQMK